MPLCWKAARTRRAPLIKPVLCFNPLSLPEILTIVGGYLVDWVHIWPSTGRSWVWFPRPLTRCLQVSRAWNEILTPVLWYCCAIQCCNPIHVIRRFPYELLDKYGHLIRILYTDYRFGERWTPHVHSRNLTALEVSRRRVWDVELVKMNPGLRRLVWYGESFRQEEDRLEEKLALCSLTRLSALAIHTQDLVPGTVRSLLANNPRLTQMTLSVGVCFDSIHDLSLPCMVQLKLILFQTQSVPFAKDVIKSCRGLQKLTLMLHVNKFYPIHDWGEMGRDQALWSLAQTLGQTCSDLTSIWFNLEEFSDGAQAIGDRPLAALISSCRRAVDLSFNAWTLGTMTTDALIRQADSLQHLSIHCECSDESEDKALAMMNAKRLLSALPHLSLKGDKTGYWLFNHGPTPTVKKPLQPCVITKPTLGYRRWIPKMLQSGQ